MVPPRCLWGTASAGPGITLRARPVWSHLTSDFTFDSLLANGSCISIRWPTGCLPRYYAPRRRHPLLRDFSTPIRRTRPDASGRIFGNRADTDRFHILRDCSPCDFGCASSLQLDFQCYVGSRMGSEVVIFAVKLNAELLEMIVLFK